MPVNTGTSEDWVENRTFTLYHTFIVTCQMKGVLVLKYFKSLLSAIAKGSTDYENMLPMTICLCKVAFKNKNIVDLNVFNLKEPLGFAALA